MKKKKWQIVEGIVASLFDSSDVKVEKNKRLKSLRRSGEKKGLREFDVLISGNLAGQHIYIPIECKNVRRKIGSPDIDAFIGKLLDVGLPTQTSIYVTTGKFTKPAIGRAAEAGMKTLRLTEQDTTKNRNKILSAIQSRIFILCSIEGISYFMDDKIPEGSFDHLQFYDKDGQFHWALPDILWSWWHKEAPLLKCGQYMSEVDVPESILYMRDGRKNTIKKIVVKFNVSALIYREKGKVNSYNLQNAMSGQLEKWKVTANFSENELKQIPFQVHSEAKLNELTRETNSINITFNRVKLPKIVMDKGLLWPPSKSMLEHFNKINPEEIEKEKENIVRTEMNSFWDFDDRYAKKITNSNEIINIKVKSLDTKEHSKAMQSTTATEQ